MNKFQIGDLIHHIDPTANKEYANNPWIGRLAIVLKVHQNDIDIFTFDPPEYMNQFHYHFNQDSTFFEKVSSL